MMNKKNWLFIAVIGLSYPLLTQAGIFDTLGCLDKGTCGLSDIEIGFQLLTNWLIGGVGALALMYFIWGAIQWITSYGKSDKVEKGKEIMVGSVTAIIIALGSYVLIQFFINNVLLGSDANNEFNVAAECVGADQGKVCNEPLRNYVCTGTFAEEGKQNYNNLCVTKCQLRNMVSDEASWTCLAPGAFTDKGSVVKFPGECPTEAELCVDTKTIQYTGAVPGAGGQVGQGGSCSGIITRGINVNQCNDASSGLTSLLTCARQRLGNGFVITSISDDDAVGNLANCQGVQYSSEFCDHVRDSCHYGGSGRLNKSCAVDLVPLAGEGLTMANILAVVRDDCGAAFAQIEASHVHASVVGCQCDGHN